MPAANYDYKKYRQIVGKNCLENVDHETIAKLLADGEDYEFINRFIPMSPEDFKSLIEDKYFLQRVMVLRQEKKPASDPKTPKEMKQYAIEGLIKLSKTGKKDDRVKIDALKALFECSSDMEDKNTPAPMDPDRKSALEKIRQSRSKKEPVETGVVDE